MKSMSPHPAPATGPPSDPTAPGTGADAATVTVTQHGAPTAPAAAPVTPTAPVKPQPAANGAVRAPAAMAPTLSRRKSSGNRRVWNVIRHRFEAGEGVTALANEFGFAPRTVRERRRDEAWRVPGMPLENHAGGRHLLAKIEPKNGQMPGAEIAQLNHFSPVIVPGGDPLNQALANGVAALICESLGTIEPPRSWAQLTQAYGLYRQAKGLDKPQPANNGRVLIQVGAARARIRECSPVVDVPNGDE